MGVPISNVTRRVVYTASGTGPYNFTFEILAAGDVAVYRDDTLLTITTDYTVTINANGTGFITLVASPTGATQIAIVGNRTIQRTTDFVTGGDFFANTVNDEMDQQTIFAQQNAEGLQRALQAPQTDPTTIDMTLPRAAIRASKVLSFDANGNPSATEFIGSNRGNWASGTLYYVRDIIKDTSTSNIWQCVVEHTSTGAQPIGTNADAAKWFLLVDAAAAGASATAAAASASAAATSASNASTSATNAASSASTASTQASNASTSATNAANSATAAASSASTASTAATNAGNSATAAATSATNASNSASSASTSASNASTSATSAASSASTATTQATNASNSASAASTSASNASTSATNAANSATASASSATAAAASAAAAAASFDAFDDIYLGAKSSDPTVDNDGNALTVGDQYFNTSANELRVYNGSTWQAASTVGGTVTSLSVTGATTLGQNPTLSAGTANGVAYLNGSKVLTTGSALTFDGTNLGFGGNLNSTLTSEFYLQSPAGSNFIGINQASGYVRVAAGNAEVLRLSNTAAIFALSSLEQMRLTSTGLGIGTSSPSYKVEAIGSSPAFFGESSTNGTQVGYRATIPSNSANCFVGWVSDAVAGLNGDLALCPRTSAGGRILFFTGSTTPSERMRLDSSGNLGLGVTPSAWNSAYKAIQAGARSVFAGSNTSAFYIGSNWFQDAGGTNRYIASSTATSFGSDGDNFAWRLAPSGTAGNAISFTQAMTLDASGNLGVGTTSPANLLHINGSNSVARFSGTSTALSAYQTFFNNSAAQAYFGIESSSGTGIIGTGAAYGMVLATASTNPLCFGTNGSERARIDSSGNLLVGKTVTTATTNGIVLNSGGTLYATSNSDAAEFYRKTSAGGNGVILTKSDVGGTNTLVGVGYANGTFAAVSDATKKKNVETARDYLQDIMSLRVVKYNWITDEDSTPKELGWIAQEVEQVFPGMVSDIQGSKILKKEIFLPMLMKCIQEQQAIINQLKARLDAANL